MASALPHMKKNFRKYVRELRIINYALKRIFFVIACHGIGFSAISPCGVFAIWLISAEISPMLSHDPAIPFSTAKPLNLI